MSLLEINEMVKSLGIDGNITYLWRIPGIDIDSGLKAIETDWDVVNMACHIPDNRVLEIYLKQVVYDDHFNVEIMQDIRPPLGEEIQDYNNDRDFVESGNDLYVDDDELFEAHVDVGIERDIRRMNELQKGEGSNEDKERG